MKKFNVLYWNLFYFILKHVLRERSKIANTIPVAIVMHIYTHIYAAAILKVKSGLKVKYNLSY